jgi:DNA polymerase III subunit epsilon
VMMRSSPLNTWRTLSKDESTVTLEKFDGFGSTKTTDIESLEQDDVKIAVAIDVETTGTDKNKDDVIEIGVRVFYFSPVSGKILGLGESFSSLNEPQKNIDSLITKITGISNSEVKNQHADWGKVSSILNSANLIVAHNARFDRNFIDKYCKYSTKPVWACSMSQVEWAQHNLPTTNLVLLSAYHGYFTNAHRALVDAEMVIKVLSLNPKYLLELYENAHVMRSMIEVSNTQFEQRTKLTKIGFRWNPMKKIWYKLCLKKDLQSEVKSIENELRDNAPTIEVTDIPLSENFKEIRQF